MRIKIQIVFGIVFSLFLITKSNAQTLGDFRTLTTTGNGNWDDYTQWEMFSGTWGTPLPGVYPGSAIGTGTVTFRKTGGTFNLTVSPAFAIGALSIAGTGGVLEISNSGNRSLQITGDLSVAIGTFRVQNAGSATHSVSVGGNIIMTGGTLNFHLEVL